MNGKQEQAALLGNWFIPGTNTTLDLPVEAKTGKPKLV